MGTPDEACDVMSHDTANERMEPIDERNRVILSDGGTGAFVREHDDGTATWVLNSLVVDRITAEDTGGAYSITEHHAHQVYETPYHRHIGEDEVLYVMDGEFTVVTEAGTQTATVGDTVVFPRGEPHALSVTSDGPARALVVCSPAGFEGFFHEVGEPASERTVPEPTEPDIGAVEALAPEYDLELLGPPPE